MRKYIFILIALLFASNLFGQEKKFYPVIRGNHWELTEDSTQAEFLPANDPAFLDTLIKRQIIPGPPGRDGYTPIKGVDYFDGAASTVPGPPGAPSIVPGPKGDSGYTPRKNIDYFDGAASTVPGPQGPPGVGTQGIQGNPGTSSYTYIAYASDAIGTGFTTTYNASLDYIAIKVSASVLTPVVSDFTGLWKNYKGTIGNTGNTGTAGTNGTDGTSNYTISVQALTSSPTDAQTVYFGTLPKAPTTTANISKVYIPKTGTIKHAEIYCYSGTAGTNEAWSLYVRLNNTTDYLIQTKSVNTSERVFSNTSLDIAVTAGQYIEIKGVQPTWVTNPLTCIYAGYIYIE
jgi:hypothetical protein